MSCRPCSQNAVPLTSKPYVARLRRKNGRVISEACVAQREYTAVINLSRQKPCRITEFPLGRYQFKDPANPEQLAEGGFLQFAMTLGPPREALPQLRAVIAKRSGSNPDAIRLAALPFKTAVANLYIPKSGLLVASEP